MSPGWPPRVWETHAMLLSVQVVASSPLPLFGKMIVTHKFRLDTAGTGESTNYRKALKSRRVFRSPSLEKRARGDFRAYAAPFIELECRAGAKETSPRHNQIPSIPLFQRGKGNYRPLLQPPCPANKLCRMIRVIGAISQGSRSNRIPATTSATPPSMRALSCSANRK